MQFLVVEATGVDGTSHLHDLPRSLADVLGVGIITTQSKLAANSGAWNRLGHGRSFLDVCCQSREYLADRLLDLLLARKSRTSAKVVER